MACWNFVLHCLGFVGELHSDKNSEDEKHVLYTHKNIIVKYNKDQVCESSNFIRTFIVVLGQLIYNS